MELFKGIEREHILQAIERVNEEGYPSNRKSSTYDLVYNNVAYPPKYILSLAGYFRNGHFIRHTEFEGGENKPSFQLFREMGFQILPKTEAQSFSKAKEGKDLDKKYLQPNYYWVNQGNNYAEESRDGFIWAPIDNYHHHRRLKDLKEGDIIIHYAKGIKATSLVQSEFQETERVRNQRGLIVRVLYEELPQTIPITDVSMKFESNSSVLPKKHSPINRKFEVNQGYLFEFNKASFDIIFNESPTAVADDAGEYKSKMSTVSNIPLNQILYGPPGTGKTYNTINKSLELIGIETNGLTREALKQLFDEKVSKGQIMTTTFHQSMSYEDFIEGIKPLKPESSDTYLKYDVEDGIFKDIAIKSKLAGSGIQVEALDKVYLEFINWVQEQIESEETLNFYSKSKTKVIVHSISDNDGLYVSPEVHDRDEYRKYLVSKNKLLALDAHFDSIDDIENVVNDIRNVIKGVGHTYYYAVLKEFKKFKKEKGISTHSNPNTEKPQNYVFIIDEINRGNVSQIFGELITLIEDDKRLGNDEALEITLPYSREKFGVPNNLYIIGTMNTADRSVESLDTALRRRFSFQEMLPNPEILKKDSKSKGEIEGIDLVKLLSSINERIEVLVDRDHTIGHAFFMSAVTWEDLRSVFADKIIPLLQEYFYGNYGKMELVIGPLFFEKKDASKITFAVKTDEFLEGSVYQIKNIQEMQKDEFLSAIDAIGF